MYEVQCCMDVCACVSACVNVCVGGGGGGGGRGGGGGGYVHVMLSQQDASLATTKLECSSVEWFSLGTHCKE